MTRLAPRPIPAEAADGEDRRRLFEALYSEIRRGAEHLSRGLPPGHTLQATALVSEAYLRLARSDERRFADREHCLAAAAQAMRCVLIDHARAKLRAKRGGAWTRTPLDQVVLSFEEGNVDLLALDEALHRLAQLDGRMAEAAELRLFGGLSVGETAAALGMARRTFERHWCFAKAWLTDALSESP